MNKQFVINLIVTIVYFLFFLFDGYGQSGGDIYVIIMTTLCVGMHLLILILLRLIWKKNIFKSLFGMGIGFYSYF